MLKAFVLLCLLFGSLAVFSNVNSCSSDPTLTCNQVNTIIEIGEPINCQRKVSDLFGLHLLFWGMQAELYGNTPAKVSPRATSILQNAGVGFLRYGGGVNEIDWHTCAGVILERPLQKVVSWAPPMRCIFGISEYEKLNEELALQSSWHIANVVGYDGKLIDTSVLAQGAKERAALIKQLAPARDHFWEMGNELDRDTLKWNEEKITKRSLPVAKSILAADPSARILIPLLEYSPPWIDNADKHNRALIKNHKSVAHDYVLHLYYENAPWGPSVSNRLSSIRNIAKIIASENINNPAIWITEHARTPPGTPVDKNWRSGWYQTGNHDAVIATSDFLIGLSQMPIVGGAAWHGQGHKVGPWTFIDVAGDGSLLETRISRLFEMLKPTHTYQTLETTTNSIIDTNLPTQYAVRATAFGSKDNKNLSNLFVWLVNRSNTELKVYLNKKSFNLDKKLLLKQTNMSAGYEPSVPIENLPVITKSVEVQHGQVSVLLPKRSVVLVQLGPDQS